MQCMQTALLEASVEVSHLGLIRNQSRCHTCGSLCEPREHNSRLHQAVRRYSGSTATAYNTIHAHL